MTTESNATLSSRFLHPGLALMLRLSGRVKFWWLQMPLMLALGTVAGLFVADLGSEYRDTLRRGASTSQLDLIADVAIALQHNDMQGAVPSESTRTALQAAVDRLGVQVGKGGDSAVQKSWDALRPSLQAVAVSLAVLALRPATRPSRKRWRGLRSCPRSVRRGPRWESSRTGSAAARRSPTWTAADRATLPRSSPPA